MTCQSDGSADDRAVCSQANRAEVPAGFEPSVAGDGEVVGEIDRAIEPDGASVLDDDGAGAEPGRTADPRPGEADRRTTTVRAGVIDRVAGGVRSAGAVVEDRTRPADRPCQIHRSG